MIITKTQLSRELGVSKGRVSQLLRAGLPVRSDGTVEKDSAVLWYKSNIVAHNREGVRPRSVVESSPARPLIALKEQPRTRAAQEAEFRQGAAWMAFQVCAAARRAWPVFVMEHWPEMSRSGQVGLMAVFCARLEVWTAAERATTAALPEFDWAALFGPDAAAAAGEYERLGREWPAVGRIDLACGPDATPGAAFLEGARACARATCVTARRMLPRLIEREVFEPGEDRFSTVHLVALLMSLIEGWMGGYVMSEWLPPIEWQMVFAAGAPEADQEYRALRQGWAA